MLPYHDENETQRPAYITGALIALNVASWLLVQGAGTPMALAASVVTAVNKIAKMRCMLSIRFGMECGDWSPL